MLKSFKTRNRIKNIKFSNSLFRVAKDGNSNDELFSYATCPDATVAQKWRFLIWILQKRIKMKLKGY